MTTDDPFLRDLLDEAAGLAPDRRHGFLAAACADKPEMRTRIESLLAELEIADEFLVDPTIPPSSLAHPNCDTDSNQGQRIDRYELLEPLGEGGMGTVYRARQLSPVRREVALKVIKLGMDTARVIARFEAERQALAMMDHPSIAKVLDAGATDSGRPFFVMELVRGVRITGYCDENKLTVRQRLDLFVQVCHAVQHAHQKGIIHRDLKPSNVLVTIHDDKPVPKVIDFGIAKATSQEGNDSGATHFTEISQPLGTPMYTSPEQVEEDGLNIDTRADVYALGVLLYELLAGLPPFDHDRLESASREELCRIIRTQMPPRPSARVREFGAGAEVTAASRGTDAGSLHAALRGDLDWIVMRCLEKDRDRRYETAAALARDIERYLRDEPVEARPPSNVYLLQKFFQRHRVGIAAACVAAILMAVSADAVVGGLWQAARASQAEAEQVRLREKAERESRDRINEELRANKVAQVLRQVIHSVQPTHGSTGQDLHVTDLLKNASLAATMNLRSLPETEIGVRLELAAAFADADENEEARENLLRAYHLACAGPEGEKSKKAVEVAADLGFFVNDVAFSRRTYGDAERMFGKADPVTQRAARSLAQALVEESVTGINRADRLREAEDISRRLVAQVEGLPPVERRPIHYKYMNQLAELLNAGQGYGEAADVVARAIARGATDGKLADSTRAALGFSMVEALHGQGRMVDAVDWARKTYDFDRATLGAFSGRTNRMLKAYVRLLSMAGQSEHADKMLREALAMAKAFYPGDNETVVDFMTTLAEYQLDRNQLEEAIGLAKEIVRMEEKVRGGLEEKGRLLAREALLGSLGARRQDNDGGIRAQVFCTLEDLWRDHPEWVPQTLKIPPAAVSFSLFRVNGKGVEPVLRSTLGDAAPAERMLEPGLYSLVVNVTLPDGRMVSRSAGILLSDWDVTFAGDERVQASDTASQLPDGRGNEHRRLRAIAAMHVFKEGPQAFWALLRTTGKTSVRLAPGRYRFSVSSVDGVRLLVDGQVAVGAWSGHGPRRDFRDLELDEGLHELRFEAFQKGRRGLLWIRIEPTPPWSADPLRSFERASGEQEGMDCPEARAAEGALMAHAGRFRDALSQYERALELDDSQLFFVQQAALINLQLDNVKAYDAACARILNERPPADDRIAAARSAVMALMKKGAEVGPGVKEMLKAGDPASAPPSQRGMCLLARGLADYRSGGFEGCVRVLEEAAGGRLTPEARAAAEVYRAMAMVHLGQARQAREGFASVRKSFDSFPMAARVELDGREVQDLLICQLAIREAGKVFGER